MVDNVIATVDAALCKTGQVSKSVERWKAEMPKEGEMVARDKYTVFDRKAKRYRKGIHSEWLFLLGVWLRGWEGGLGDLIEGDGLIVLCEQRYQNGQESVRGSIRRGSRIYTFWMGNCCAGVLLCT